MLNSCARNILVLLISSLSIPYVLKSVMFRRAGVCREGETMPDEDLRLLERPRAGAGTILLL
jgi:hypothetical protein